MDERILASCKKVQKLKIIVIISLLVGIGMFVVTWACSSFLPIIASKEREIYFEEYDQDLYIGDLCYIDIEEVTLLGGTKETISVGGTYMSDGKKTAYFLVMDTNDNPGIICINEEDAEKFVSETIENETFRCYGKIVTAPTNIGADLTPSYTPEDFIEGAPSPTYEDYEEFEETYEARKEEANILQENLGKYLNMECELEMEKTELVPVPGPGVIPLIIAGVGILTFLITFRLWRSERYLMQSLIEWSKVRERKEM